MNNRYLAIKYKVKRKKDQFMDSKLLLGTICLIIGISWTYNYIEFKSLMADHAKALQAYERVIENRSHSAVLNSEEKSDDDGASESVQSTSQEEVTRETPLDGRTTEQIIEDTAKQHGFKDVELLKKIAMCESSMNPQAKNTESTATGVYQYLSGTWEEACKKTGHTDWTLEDRTDVEKATRVAIWHISRGELSRWNASKSCWNS